MNKPETPPQPPNWGMQLIERLAAPHLREEILGDLDELFHHRGQRLGYARARWLYVLDILFLLHPRLWRRPAEARHNIPPNPRTYTSPLFVSPAMLHNYLKIAGRNLARNKAFSTINIGGLTVGMAVITLIGLWIYDELSVNRYHQHYDRIAQVLKHQTVNGTINTGSGLPIPLVTTLQTTYGGNFKRVVLADWTNWHTLVMGKQVVSKSGKFMTPEAPEMLSLTMLKGRRDGLNEPASILLSESASKALFGKANPLHKVMTIDKVMTVQVTGIYEDIPAGNSFADVQFIASWNLYAASTGWVNNEKNNWNAAWFEIFVELAPQVSAEAASATISNLFADKSREDPSLKTSLFLYPMSQWHLYSDWKNGVNVGGRIQFVWLFGIIGSFVLLLACINFMNLSTARSINRAKEVGIRKAIGSQRSQLVAQFFGESLLVVGVAFILSILLLHLSVPFFNQLADKQITVPWANPVFWALSVGFMILTGLLAGSYPALYLSSFRPVAALKGLVRVGTGVVAPRQVLVIVQFTVSITLIIGTIVVFRQIQLARNRPIGYSRDGLISLVLNVPRFEDHRETIREELLGTGAIVELAESEGPTTEVRSHNAGFSWPGKHPALHPNFATVDSSPEFGRTVGWQFKQGRDFSRKFASDSSGVVLNESAVAFMGLQHPLNQTITSESTDFSARLHVIGVIRDMVMDSPYEPVKPTLFFFSRKPGKFLIMRLNPARSAQAALNTIGDILKKRLPEAPFNYTFVNDDYDQKFRSEERVGQLATLFSGLAIFISCLGLFGLASFIAEQRLNEIGIRKVLGASVGNLWQLLSKDFVRLVGIAFLLAAPLAYYLLHNWLLRYEYRTDISWWVFVATGAGAVLITLLTVSYQAIKAARLDPVKSLRSQ